VGLGRKVCHICGEPMEVFPQVLPVCVACLRSEAAGAREIVEEAHRQSRKPFQLVDRPPRDSAGLSCNLCVNECSIGESQWGYCGLRTQKNGVLQGVSEEIGNVSWYYDGLPSNCVADWVCPGGTGSGYPWFSHSEGPEYGFKNLAVFYHGCSFDCLFCQNWTHRGRVGDNGRTRPEELVRAVDDLTSCICYFGGDPTPQLPHAIEVSKKALEMKDGGILRICWETNGSMNPRLLEEMVTLSLESGGCVKFDIKAWNDSVHRALCGVTNQRTKENFERAVSWMERRPEPPPLVASTLLIPGYIDEKEIENIARWLASLNPDIPYALLAFYPQFFFKDLPITPRSFALRCEEIAKGAGLRRVRIGNWHLLEKDDA
jgi:pyruvate formate lyase activating enzyme